MKDTDAGINFEVPLQNGSRCADTAQRSQLSGDDRCAGRRTRRHL